jgi:hypothetical protein
LEDILRNYVYKKEYLFNEVLANLREGKSLYAACVNVGMSTSEFYEFLNKNDKFKEKYLSALTDYADKCVDDIRRIVEELKSGKIDNSTAKLLIETKKWLVSKANGDVIKLDENDDINAEVKEIMVKFIE